MKIIIDGRVHVHQEIIGILSLAAASRTDVGTDAKHAIEELCHHEDMADGEYLPLEIVGSPDEGLRSGMVLISSGPVAIECCANDLCRAMMAFLGGVR